jgi:hypothetical protein
LPFPFPFCGGNVLFESADTGFSFAESCLTNVVCMETNYANADLGTIGTQPD